MNRPRQVAEPTSAVILMYHSICDRATRGFRDFVVPPEVFEEHMATIRCGGFTTVTMSELSRLRSSESGIPPRTVAVTFDDGYQDFISHAQPIMALYSVRATLYVTTHYVGATSRWLAPEGEQNRPMLDWDELSHVVACGVECGAHTHTHPQLDLLDRATAAREIATSKALLEDHLQIPVSSFAYPFGYSSARVRNLVRRLGFTNACVVGDLVSDTADEAFSIPRLTITPDVTAPQLEQMLISTSSAGDRFRARSRGRASFCLRHVGLKKQQRSTPVW